MDKKKRMKPQKVTPEKLAFANWFHKYQEKTGRVVEVEDFPCSVSLEAFLSVHPMELDKERRKEVEVEYERRFMQAQRIYHEEITFSKIYDFFYEKLAPRVSNIPKETTRH